METQKVKRIYLIYNIIRWTIIAIVGGVLCYLY